jgi:glycerophosphoryl diester phosphodiesterase
MGEPTQPRHPFLEWPGPIAFAHRGGGSEAPENTMPAFQHAVETDVRITADGVAIAFHDENLQRICGRPERISELPWRELETVRVNGAEPIALLEDVFGTWPDARINVDCKDDRSLEPLAAMVERFDALDRTLVAAFDDRRVRWLRRRLGPRACTVAGLAEVSALRITGWTPSGANATQIPIRRYGIPLATPGFVRRAHARRLAVHVWTIDDAPEMERLLDLGADGIMTDRPSVLKGVLQQRGAWF